MNPQTDQPGSENEISVPWLIKSLTHGIRDGLRNNKLAALLAFVTAIALIALAVETRSDGLTDYQEFILPRLLRLEAGFRDSLRSAQSASGEWRSYYFENAHRQVKDILRVAKRDRPRGYTARAKHRGFIRYYEALDSEFNMIGLQTSVNPDFDYLSRITNKINDLKPIRDAWAQWADPRKQGS